MKSKTHLRDYLLLGIISAISLGGYLLASRLYFRFGFPLDDAWIHQTYARNLAATGEWAFLPGQPSSGSTSPGWTALLAIGNLISATPYAWTFFVGWICLWALSLAGSLGSQILSGEAARFSIIPGILICLEWHLVWAAGSGMETILLGSLALIVVIVSIHLQTLTDKTGWFWLGALVGLSTWIRPDGITLLGVAGFAWLTAGLGVKDRWRSLTVLLTGFVVLFLPYLAFNYQLSGEIWPNTFYAKQAEYGILQEIPIWQRYFEQASLPLIGAGVVLLPGFVWFIYRAIHNKLWVLLPGPIWIFGFLGIYAWRLPVTYQHGRYIIPILPAYLLFSFVGMDGLIRRSIHVRYDRVWKPSWSLIVGGVLLGFWVLGARSYARDVAIIESEMVDTARWIQQNIETDALVAAHDIGALGYFGGRELIDLAGLVSPEVIPFIRDERALLNYLNQRGSDYLVTFPGWYPYLVERSRLVFKTGGIYSPALGGENMAVYRWDSP